MYSFLFFSFPSYQHQIILGPLLVAPLRATIWSNTPARLVLLLLPLLPLLVLLLSLLILLVLLVLLCYYCSTAVATSAILLLLCCYCSTAATIVGTTAVQG